MNEPSVVSRLLHLDCDVCAADARGNTALHLAAKSQSPGSLTALLAGVKSTDILIDVTNQKNDDGKFNPRPSLKNYQSFKRPAIFFVGQV